MTDFEKVDRVRRRCSADTCLFCLPSGANTRSFWIGIFHIGNFCFWVPFLKQLLLINCAVDFVEICKVYVGKMVIKAAKRIFNSDKICRSYSDLNFGVTFLEHSLFRECFQPRRLARLLGYQQQNAARFGQRAWIDNLVHLLWLTNDHMSICAKMQMHHFCKLAHTDLVRRQQTNCGTVLQTY